LETVKADSLCALLMYTTVNSRYTANSTTRIEIMQDVMIRDDMMNVAKSGLNKGFKRGYEMVRDYNSGGSGEIRTHERLPFAGFQDQCNRPLCHASIAIYAKFRSAVLN
jgi:hypothetical protein